MREIRVGNILMFRKERACIICRIITGTNGLPDKIIGIDHNNSIYEGEAAEWSSIIHRKSCLRTLEEGIFNNIVSGRGY